MAKDKRKAVKPARKAPRPAKPSASERAPGAVIPVVGIGASAGGLEAFTKLLQHLPTNTHMAFVLIQHLDPKHESMLTSLLSRATSMPVQEVSNQMPVEPDHVYVIPANTNMTIAGSRLLLTRRLATDGQHKPIDHFFESLAESLKSQAVGVVLSGTASDGTAGLRAIKDGGGITFAQDQKSARYDGMPRNAISSGVVDFIFPPEDIARELVKISRHPYVAGDSRGETVELPGADKDNFNKIFKVLRSQTGSDFSSYKSGTIERRLRRRMVLQKKESIPEYIKLLHENRDEVQALYDDLLINVTEFYRDPKTFEALKKDVFPQLLQGRSEDTPIRIWVAGCSTGEEAYSIAMSLVDFLIEAEADNAVQVFGTDVSEIAIGKARIGLYPESAMAKVPPDFVRRFFNKVDYGYRIGKRIRDVCVFARQDLGKDPPFSRLDLISCRNVLIYLGNDLQNRVIPMFHYALNPEGFLLLGSAETVGASNLFAVVDKTHKIYRKRPGEDRPHLDFPVYQTASAKPSDAAREGPWNEYDLQKESDRVVLAKYGPAGVVINEQMEIVQFRGNVNPYLQPASGAASLNFLKMLRHDIASDLRSAIDLAKRGTVPVRREGLRVDSEELRSFHLSVEIVPLNPPADRDRLYVVLFETAPRAAAGAVEAPRTEAADGETKSQIESLEQELAAAKEHLRFLMDEQQASEEELRSANEEIMSSNEELQSTNEELETSQEELQSANEELTTVNDELQHRNTELSQLGNDLTNLLTSVNIPIVMLGIDLRVRHFTPTAGRVLNLRAGDVGRPISEIKSNLDIPDLEALLSGVIQDLTPKEMEARDRNGAWYSMRIRPYRTEDNKIDGAVIVLYDVDQLKRSLQEVQQARDFTRAIVETVPNPLVALDADLRVIIANRAFYDTFHLHPQGTEGKAWRELANGQWNIPALTESLKRALLEKPSFEDLEIESDFKRVGHKIFSLDGRRFELGESQRKILLLAISDITSQKLSERQMQATQSTLTKSLEHAETSLRESESDLRHNREELRGLAARLLTTQEEERRRVSRELHDDLNQKLAMLEVDAERLGQRIPESPEIGADLRSLRNRAAEVSNDIRRVAYQLHPSILDHLGLGVALRSYCSEFSKHDGIQVKFSADDQLDPVPEDIALCLYRVTQEGLRNVAKHASAKTASVALKRAANRIHLCIRDNGGGFDPTAKIEGGIGLLSMKERVRLVDGEFTLKSKLGQGTRIDVWAPLPKGSS